jgi:hypothetical protein
MRVISCFALAVFLQQTNGCDQPPSAAKPDPPKAIHPIARFVPVDTHGSSDVALDTMTGQLCRTWEWQYRGSNNPNKGGLDDLPVCYQIYLQYPYTDPVPAVQTLK